MYPISQTVKALYEVEQRQVLRITWTEIKKFNELSAYSNNTRIYKTDNGQRIRLYQGTTEVFDSSDTTKIITLYSGDLPIYTNDPDGAVIHHIIREENIMERGFSIDRYSCNGNKLEVGTAVAAEMVIRLDNREGQFNGINFEGQELLVEIGIADWSASNPEIQWMPCGYFTCYEQPRTMSTITIHAYDRMMQFDKEPVKLTPWTANGETVETGYGEIIYMLEKLTFPCSVSALITQCCDFGNVPFTQDISGFPNYNATITSMPELQQEITLRNIIQWCAGIMGTNAWIDWNGALRFSWYDTETGYTSTHTNRYSSDLYENAISLTGVRYVDSNESAYLAGTSGYVLDISDNALIESTGAENIINNIFTEIQGFSYTPFSATIISAPYLWPMDCIEFVDADYNSHDCILTNVHFGMNDKTDVSGIGETNQTNTTTKPAAFTAQQFQDLQKISSESAKSINAAVDHATQMITGGLGGYVVLTVNANTGATEEILIMDSQDRNTAKNVWRFNSGGLGHSSSGYNGPYMDIALTADGQINANMITVGEMVADRIRGGTLTLGGLNDENGVLKILDKVGNIIGSWDKDGINATKGTFSGELKAATGTFSGTLKAADGTFLGTISANNITSGTLDANRIAAHSIAVSKLTGSINGGPSNSWQIDLDNGTLTIGNISASNVTTGTMSADRISGGSIDATNVTITNLNASNISSGTLSADRIAANSIAVSKLTGSISGGINNSWEINLTNGTITVGSISAANITTGTMSANRISGGSIDATDVTITNLSADVFSSGPIQTSGNNLIIDPYGEVEFGSATIKVNGYTARSAVIIVDGNTYNFYNGILVENI